MLELGHSRSDCKACMRGRLVRWAQTVSMKLNSMVELFIALLMFLLVLDVWLGVIDRYLFHWQLPWPETLARYLMIWAALLAISSGIARREHINLSLVIRRIPNTLRRSILLTLDILAFTFFSILAFYGIDFALGGAERQAMIFGMSLGLPFAAVPVAALLAAVQQLLVAIRDGGKFLPATLEDDSPIAGNI